MYTYTHFLKTSSPNLKLNVVNQERLFHIFFFPLEIFPIANKCPRGGTSLSSLLTKALFIPDFGSLGESSGSGTYLEACESTNKPN